VSLICIQEVFSLNSVGQFLRVSLILGAGIGGAVQNFGGTRQFLRALTDEAHRERD
jgi:hypothetical protein